ncbi:hypothetical protein [Streptomyces misionensis]|uniref:hypothetical protein n=1 Tax=Streptomyces misionensis TaxID=67331 RepID=UPI00340E17C6
MYPETTANAEPATGQEATPLADAIVQAAIDNAIREARLNDASPTAVIGTTPPVAQPGRPPMSQGATDASVLMLAGGASASMLGLTTAVVMYVSQYADPAVCAIVFGAPTALVLALARLAKRAKPAPTVHHHYEGPVHQDQRNVTTTTRGVWAKTNNHQ